MNFSSHAVWGMIENSYKKFLAANTLSIFQRKCVHNGFSLCRHRKFRAVWWFSPSVGVVCSKISIRVCGLLDVCKAWPCRNSSLRPSIWVAHCTFLIRQSRLAQVSVLNRAPQWFDFNSVFWSPWSRTVGDLCVSSVPICGSDIWSRSGLFSKRSMQTEETVASNGRNRFRNGCYCWI